MSEKISLDDLFRRFLRRKQRLDRLLLMRRAEDGPAVNLLIEKEFELIEKADKQIKERVAELDIEMYAEHKRIDTEMNTLSKEDILKMLKEFANKPDLKIVEEESEE